jgi:hypothetical protein
VNAFALGQILEEGFTGREAPAVAAFKMVKTEALHSFIVPIGDGLWVEIRK